MATNKTTYPNTYFAWFNDDNRIAILAQDTTSSSTERTTEKYDTFQGDDVSNGLRITYHSKYGTIDAQSDDLKTDAGLDSGMHPSVVCYIKSRLFEDMGDLQKSQYFRTMYEKGVHEYPLRKSGIRVLSVPSI